MHSPKTKSTKNLRELAVVQVVQVLASNLLQANFLLQLPIWLKFGE